MRCGTATVAWYSSAVMPSATRRRWAETPARGSPWAAARPGSRRHGRRWSRPPSRGRAGWSRVLAEGHRARREAVEAALAGWSGEDRETFARLLRDYVAGWERATARHRD